MVRTGVYLARTFAVTTLIGLPVFGPAATANAAPPTPEPAPTAGTAMQILLSELPGGYAPDDCQPVTPPDVTAALAEVSCGANHGGGGPASAYLYLFANAADMNTVFRNTLAHTTVQPFPDGSSGPGTWSLSATPKQVAGSFAFVTAGDGTSNLLWTDNAKLLQGDTIPATNNADLQGWFFTQR